MTRPVDPFHPDTFYHVYNHAVGSDDLFRCDENYRYFLDRYAAYVSPIAATFAYCLMPNHFHMLLRLRPGETLRRFFRVKGGDEKPGGSPRPDGFERERALGRRISQQFGNWLNAYAKAFNRRYERRGRLFFASLQRKPVTNERYLHKLVHYIHYNAVHHGFVEHPSGWRFSTYQTVLDDAETLLERERVLDWFGGRAGYGAAHRRPADERLAPLLEAY